MSDPEPHLVLGLSESYPENLFSLRALQVKSGTTPCPKKITVKNVGGKMLRPLIGQHWSHDQFCMRPVLDNNEKPGNKLHGEGTSYIYFHFNTDMSTL